MVGIAGNSVISSSNLAGASLRNSQGTRAFISFFIVVICWVIFCAQSSASVSGSKSSSVIIFLKELLSVCNKSFTCLMFSTGYRSLSSRRSKKVFNNSVSVDFSIKMRVASAMPFNTSSVKIFLSDKASKPCCIVSRWPARLPLSTVDIYLGDNGDSVIVSYQL